MELTSDNIYLLWDKLIWPLIRLIFYISLGLLVANIIESFQWTKRIAHLTHPLIKLGRMSNIVGASFAVAMFSGVSANSMLAEAYEKQQICKKELILANLFNSLPTYFLHLPTVFFIALALLKGSAFIYIGLTLGAAVFRTSLILVLNRFIFAEKKYEQHNSPATQHLQHENISTIWKNIFKRFTKRIKKILVFTVPIYTLIFFMHRNGFFKEIELFLSSYLAFIPWLSPQSIGIVTLHLAAELTAGLAAAGALLQEGAIPSREVIIALLVGNILSSPVRAIRHQFPYYAGIFKPQLATELIIYSQSFRIGSLMLMGMIYILCSS